MTSTITSKLRPWQPPLVESSIAGLETGNFLNASGLGTGKTYVALAAAAAMRLHPVVVARLGALTTWREIAEQFGLGLIPAINREALRTGHSGLGHWEAGEYNPDTNRRARIFRWTMPGNLLILDEIHNDCSASDSMAGGMLRDAVAQGIKIMGLSGTAVDDPRKMRGLGYMLGLHNDNDFWQWLARQGATRLNWSYGLSDAYLKTKKGRNDLSTRRLKTMADINARLIANGRMVRLPASAIPGFPKCTVQPMAIDFDDEGIARAYEEMASELANLKARTGQRHSLEILMRARQRTELLEIPGLVDEISDAIADGNSVVAFLNFKDSVKALAERFKTDCLYTGDQSPAEKDHNRLRFRKDEERLIIVNVDAGGESVGFEDVNGNFPRVGYVIPSFRTVSINQVLGRLPRDGAKSPSIYRIIFARKSVEMKAYKAFVRRTELYGAFNGDVKFEDADMLEMTQ